MRRNPRPETQKQGTGEEKEKEVRQEDGAEGEGYVAQDWERAFDRAALSLVSPHSHRDLFIDNVLVRIHLITRTGLAPCEFELPLPCSLTSAFRNPTHASYSRLRPYTLNAGSVHSTELHSPSYHHSHVLRPCRALTPGAVEQIRHK